MVVLEPFIVCDQIIQCSCSGSSELMGQGVKLLESGLISFPKEQIDVPLIRFGKGFHEMSLVGTSLFMLSRRPDLNSDSPKPNQGPGGVCRSSSPSGCRTHGGPSSMI